MKNLLPLYARHEPPSDEASVNYYATLGQFFKPSKNYREVVIYRDPEAQNRAGRYPWHYSNKPNRRNKYIMKNCNRYRLIWLPEAKAKGE